MNSSTAAPGLDHQHHLARPRQSLSTSSFDDWQPTNFLPLARPAMNSIDFARRAIEHGDAIAAALHVQRQVLAHHGQSDQSEISKFSAMVRLLISDLLTESSLDL